MKRIFASLAGVVMATAAVAQNPAPIPIADFMRVPEADSAQLSPGGDYIAVSRMVNDNKNAVGVTELANNKVTATVAFGERDSVGAYDWVGSRLVVSIAQAFGRLDQALLTGEIYGVDANGKNAKYLFGYRGAGTTGTKIQVGPQMEQASAFMIAPLRGDPGHALIDVRPWADSGDTLDETAGRLDRMNVATGKRQVIDKPGLYSLQTATDDFGKQMLALGFDRPGALHLLARRGEGQWTSVALPDVKGGRVSLAGVTRDGSAGYFTVVAGGGSQCLYQYTFAGGAVTQLTCGNYQSVVMSRADNKPIALTYEEGLPRTEYLLPDHPEAKRLKAISGAFAGQRVTLVNTSDDGTKALLRVDSDRNPGVFYLVDDTNRSLRPVVPQRRWIDPRLMQPMTPVSIKAGDGAELPAYLTARDGLKTRKAPLVVLPHGGPHLRDYWEWNREVQLLASRGYAVLQVNFRGSAGYGYDFEAAGYGGWGTRMQQDIADATRWAIAQGIADPARVCIYGASFGGYSAVMSVAREPDLYRCAAAYAGVYDLDPQAGDSDIAKSRYSSAEFAESLGDKAGRREQSPVTHVGKIKAALLIAHGTHDKRVPFSQAKRLRSALDQAKKPYEWVEYAGEEHGFFKTENEIDFYTKLLAFLDKHIGPGAGGKG